MAERRMLWKRVSLSRKLNSVSLKAALLWTWAIPHFDQAGFIEADPETIKSEILPKRKDIRLKVIPELIKELTDIGLWDLYECKDGTIVAKDPKFFEMQRIQPEREAPSKLTLKNPKLINSRVTPELLQRTLAQSSIKKSSLNKDNLKKNNIKKDSKKDFEVLKDLSLKICDKYPKFNPYQFVQWAIKDEASCPNCLLTDIIPAFRYLDGHDRIVNPWGECRKIAEDEKRKREIIEREQSWESKKIESEDDIKKWLGTIKDIP